MNVLMLSVDDSLFPADERGSNTIQRVKRYLDALQQKAPASTLTILIYTTKPYKAVSPDANLHLIPIKSRRVQFFPFQAILEVVIKYRHLRPDLVTAQDPFEVGLLGLWLKWFYGIPLEIQMHGNFFSPYWRQEHPWYNRARQALARFIIARSQSIRVVCSSIKRDLMAQWAVPENRISVLPTPVFYAPETVAANSLNPDVGSGVKTHQNSGTHDARDWLAADAEMILFVGQFCYPKNLPGLFQVARQILQERPQAHLVLVGNGVDLAYVVVQAKAIDPTRVHLIGWLSHREIRDYYQQAAVLVVPSLYEGFGRVLVEGYLQGTPAVATRCGGPEDIVLDQETGFLTDVDHMDEFAKSTLWLLANPDEAAAMGRRGRDYVVRTFPVDELVEQVAAQWAALGRQGA